MKDPYFSQPGISNSMLAHFKKSPMHYQHALKNPIKPTYEMNLGNLIHCLVFEPEALVNYFHLAGSKPNTNKDFRDSENKRWKDLHEAKAKEEDKIFVDTDMLQVAKRSHDAIMSDKLANDLFTNKSAKKEIGVFWKKEGEACKGKLDVGHDYYIADLKNTWDASPNNVRKMIVDRDIHRQLGMYADGLKDGLISSLQDIQEKEYFVVAAEYSEPHGVTVNRLTPELVWMGMTEYVGLLIELKHCIKRNIWPGYSFRSTIDNEGLFIVDVPKWMQNE